MLKQKSGGITKLDSSSFVSIHVTLGVSNQAGGWRKNYISTGILGYVRTFRGFVFPLFFNIKTV